MHPSITLDRVVRAVKRSMRDDLYIGFCLTCGRKAKQSCEPDAEHYPCLFKSCGAATVSGAEQILFQIHA